MFLTIVENAFGILADLSAVLGVVVDEHVLGDADNGAGRLVEAVQGGDGHLEAPHVARVARVLQAVLVALQEELELVPETRDMSSMLARDIRGTRMGTTCHCRIRVWPNAYIE